MGGGDNGPADCQTPPGAGAQPVFLLCNSDVVSNPYLGEVFKADCYGSVIVGNPNVDGTPIFICDGNSSGGLQAEENIISAGNFCTGFPASQNGQKTNNDGWCIKVEGMLNNPAKTDETHGYALINRSAICPGGDMHGDTPGPAGVHPHEFVVGGYERLSNSGSVRQN